MQGQQHRASHIELQRPRPCDSNRYLPASFPSVKLPSFTGKEDWSTWITQFEVIAGRFQWTDEDMLDQLLPRLEGAAAEFVFSQLRKDTINSYPDLVREINIRFTPIETSRSFAAKLSRRRQRPGETVEEFAAEVKRLYDKAHKYRDQRTRQEDLLTKFLDGLIDEDMRFELEFSKEPNTIDEAVFFAVNWIQLRGRTRKKYQEARRVYREADYDEESQQAVRQISSNCNEDGEGDENVSLRKMIQDIMSRLDRIDERTPWKSTREERRKMVKCFNCNKQGHYARECPDGKSTGETEKSNPLNMKGPNRLA